MYAKHSKIPPTYRRLILEETNEMRVRDVPLSECNEIIMNYIEEQNQFFEEFTRFQIEAFKDGKRVTIPASSVDEADDLMDQIIEFGERKDVTMVLKQNGRLIRGYINGEVIYPSSYEGKINVTHVSKIV